MASTPWLDQHNSIDTFWDWRNQYAFLVEMVCEQLFPDPESRDHLLLQQYLIEELHKGFVATGRKIPSWPVDLRKLDMEERLEVAKQGQGITGLTELHRKLSSLNSLFTRAK